MSESERLRRGRGFGALRSLPGAVPPTGLVLLAILTVQLGAAIAKGLFAALGPGGTVFVRVLFAALVLSAVWRPRVRGRGRADFALALLFGLALAGMNLSIYLSIDRIPLGIAVTLEFVGPLGVAVAHSRRPTDVVWVVLAGAGVLLLAPLTGTGRLDPLGVGLALLSGGFWAAYIVLGVRVGRAFPGGSGLSLAMCLAAVLLAPVGIASAGAALLEPRLLLAGAAVAMLSSAIPYSLELEALRRLPARVFGVLMSLEPCVAALVGLVILREGLGARDIAAIALVTAASAGASRTGGTAPPPHDEP